MIILDAMHVIEKLSNGGICARKTHNNLVIFISLLNIIRFFVIYRQRLSLKLTNAHRIIITRCISSSNSSNNHRLHSLTHRIPGDYR